MALPAMIIGVLALISPFYIQRFGSSEMGWGMVAADVLMMTVGGLRLKKISNFKF
jgi:tight adherence protein B